MSNTNEKTANEERTQDHLTSGDINKCREQLTDIIIAPYDESKAQGVGYNFSLSEMIYSITRNKLVPICRGKNETFFYLHPQETVLALSYEYIKVSNEIAGTFHSRVRMTAEGVGSISTTLDPGWKGMGIFSLNNPTKKKIKIVLDTRVNGGIHKQAINTLIVWKINRKERGKSDDDMTLHLDNPPMRIDIWSELAAKPVRLFGNRKYQEFCKLVKELSPINLKPSEKVAWAVQLTELLDELLIAIKSKESDESAMKIQMVLIKLKRYKEVPYELKKCLDILIEKGESDNIWQACQAEEYISAIQRTDREIEYQLLCDQVEQIHQLISQRVPTSWNKNFFAYLWHWITQNVAVISATLIAVVLVIYGQSSGDIGFWGKIITAMLPMSASILHQFISGRE